MSKELFNGYMASRKMQAGGKPAPVTPIFDMSLLNRHAYGGKASWRKRAKAEYGKGQDPLNDVDPRALRDNVELITAGTIEPPTGTFIMPEFEEEYNAPKIQEDVTKLTVNKNGWADKQSYRDKREDGQFIMNTQNYLNEQGMPVDVDGEFGNQTFKAMNQYLTNKKLNNYSNTNFTEDQFYDQIYKESHGKNGVVSDAGAMGIAQFLPSTFAWAKEKGWIPETANITDQPAQSLAQRKYMDHLYNDIAVVKSATTKPERQARAFASYNHGPDNFKDFWNGLSQEDKDGGWEKWHKKANDETQKYVLWMMDKDQYKELYDTPEERTRTDGSKFITSKWNDVHYGYPNWRRQNHIYRY